MAKDINKQPYDETTLAKLDIFEQYLVAWLPVFFHSKRAMIWDFFAGSGQDTEGVAGSPLRILRTIEKYRDQIFKKDIVIDIILNEASQKKFQDLRQSVNNLFDENSWDNKVSISVCNEEFQDIFREQYTLLRQQPNLLFIDQYGVKEITGDIFQMLIELDKTDFLFFISSSAMKRFAKTPEFKTYFPDIDPTIITDAKYQDIHRIMLDYYKGRIPKNNRINLYPFTLKKGARIYGLVFGSKHPLGVEKFLDLAWDKNKINGEANFDIDEDIQKQHPTLFPEMKQSTKRDVFEARLEDYINERSELTNRDVYYFTLNHGHPKFHARECIMRLKKEGKVECQGKIGFSYESCVKSEPKTITARHHG